MTGSDAQPGPGATDTIAARDETIARLEHELESLRRILVDYMSARESTEDELRASEERYRSLIHRAAYGIFRATLDGHFVEVNPALVRTLGYPNAAALLATGAGTVYYESADHARVISAALRGEHTGWTEVRWRRLDGAPVLIRLTLQVVHNPAGNAVALEGMTEDITDRARQEELLRRSERMASLGHMLAGVAHELNNPLAAIGGFAQLLLRDIVDPDDHSALETINHEAQRAARIVRDLLAFSRRHENELRERVDINDVVRYILDAQRYQIETQGIRRELSLAAGLPPVLAQASQLEQVVLNLVVNARQALEHSMDGHMTARRAGESVTQPLISLRTTFENGFVTLEVHDNGPGIPEEHRARIWDPFWTTKDEGEGTGLGLAVVHGIVSTYGGTIHLETEAGGGTRFVVRLPPAPPPDATPDLDPPQGSSDLGPDDATAPAAAPAMAPGDSARALADTTKGTRSATPSTERPRASRADQPLRILVVDDETAILDLIARYFTGRGHTVVTTPDGAHAIDLARSDAFDVVICDLRMPALDGSQVIRQLHTLPTCQATRYIVSTGDRSAVDDLLLVEAPALLTILEKPYDIDVLRHNVEQATTPHAS